MGSEPRLSDKTVAHLGSIYIIQRYQEHYQNLTPENLAAKVEFHRNSPGPHPTAPNGLLGCTANWSVVILLTECSIRLPPFIFTFSLFLVWFTCSLLF